VRGARPFRSVDHGARPLPRSADPPLPPPATPTRSVLAFASAERDAGTFFARRNRPVATRHPPQSKAAKRLLPQGYPANTCVEYPAILGGEAHTVTTSSTLIETHAGPGLHVDVTTPVSANLP